MPLVAAADALGASLMAAVVEMVVISRHPGVWGAAPSIRLRIRMHHHCDRASGCACVQGERERSYALLCARDATVHVEAIGAKCSF